MIQGQYKNLRPPTKVLLWEIPKENSGDLWNFFPRIPRLNTIKIPWVHPNMLRATPQVSKNSPCLQHMNGVIMTSHQPSQHLSEFLHVLGIFHLQGVMKPMRPGLERRKNK